MSHIIGEPIIVKLLISEIWFDGRILALSAYLSGTFLSKKKTPIVGAYRQACSGIPLAVGFVGRDRLL